MASIKLDFPSYKKYSIKQQQWKSGGGRGGRSLLHNPYRYVLSQRVWFLVLFGLKTGIHFAHFCLKLGMVFEGTKGVYKHGIISIPNEYVRYRNM